MSDGSSAAETHPLISEADVPHIAAARERTPEALSELRGKLESAPMDDDASIVLMGSWGRQEVTSSSDQDYMLLFNNARREGARPTLDDIEGLLGDGDEAPGREGVFGEQVWLPDLRDRLGTDDDNLNLTRRMLLILESCPAVGDECHQTARRELIESYLEANVKDFRPPRYFLNDVVRYWRTIATDFEGKHRNRKGEGWGLRNAKLRLSRKVLFAGGLLPLLRCATKEEASMAAFLDDQFARPPLDRLAAAFCEQGMEDAGVRALRAYDTFLGILDDPEKRKELSDLDLDDADDSALFETIRDLGGELQDTLASLLFDAPANHSLVREYLIF